MRSEKLPPEGKAPVSAAEAAERLARIVDAAESAAESVLEDAQEQARQHVGKAKAQADRLAAQRLRELADELDPPQSEPVRAPHLKSVDPMPAADEAPAERRGAAGARLLATQMAVSGSSRKEIEERLQSGFDIEHTGEILDAILGPEE